MLVSIKHSKSLPYHINSHQVMQVSQLIHDKVSEAVLPLTETKPQYQAISLTLDTFRAALDQLNLAHNQRKAKTADVVRSLGVAEGQSSAELTLGIRKREANQRRATLVKRLRQALSWKVSGLALDIGESGAESAEFAYSLMVIRRDEFEGLSYEESDQEFDYFFQDFDQPEAQAALNELGHTQLYAAIKDAHADFKNVHLAQTQLDAELEESPRAPSAVKEVRQIARVLLTMIHFDLSSGDPTLGAVMGQIDEAIDKVRAVAERRKTLAKQEAAKAEAKKQDDSPAASDSTESNADDSDDQASPDAASGDAEEPEGTASSSSDNEVNGEVDPAPTG